MPFSRASVRPADRFHPARARPIAIRNVGVACCGRRTIKRSFVTKGEPGGPANRPIGVDVTRVAGFACAVLAASWAWPAPAGASPSGVGQEDAGVRLTVEAGIDGYRAPGRPYPVTVTLTADRLVDGVVVVVVPGMNGPTRLERHVEVSGGSTARFTMLAPGSQRITTDRVTARLTGEDDVSANAAADVEDEPSQELVGVMPEAAGTSSEPLGTVPLVVDVGLARLVRLDLDLLASGPLAVEPLDQIVASPGELDGLDDSARAALTSWVSDGGQLVLAGESGSPPEWLPDAWTPPAGGSVRAGLGQVRWPGREWRESLAPSPTRSSVEEEIMASDVGGFVDEPMQLRLGRDAGVELPAAGRLGVWLIVYVAIIGPGIYLAVRWARRREAAWAAVPVVALVATGVVFTAGSSLRNAAEVAQVNVFEVGPDAAVASTWSLLPSSRGGDVGVELPAGWTGAAAVDEFGDFGIVFDDQGNPVSQTRGDGEVRMVTDGDNNRVVQDVGPGGYALIEARGPVPELGGALEVEATTRSDGQIEGVVRNRLDVALHSVAVFAGRAAAVPIGTVGPGEEKEFVVDGANMFAWGATPELQVWEPSADGFGGGFAEAGVVATVNERVIVGQGGAVLVGGGSGGGAPGDGEDGGDDDSDAGPSAVLDAWRQTLQRTGTNYRPTGQVVVAGWTDELDSPASPLRGRSASTTSAVVARATPTAVGTRLTDVGTIKSIVRGPISQEPADTPEAVAAGGIGAVFAFDLPARVDGRPVDIDRLAINPADVFITFDIWTPGGWVPLNPPARGQDEYPLPAGAVVGDTVYARITVPTDVIPGSGRDLVLYEREPA
jgi:hypothetical protein